MIVEEGTFDDFKRCVMSKITAHQFTPCGHILIDRLYDLDDEAWYSHRPFDCPCNSHNLQHVISTIIHKPFKVVKAKIVDTVPVLVMGQPNKNGRIYGRKAVKNAMKLLGDKKLIVYERCPDYGRPVPPIAGTATLQLAKNKLLAHIQFIDNNCFTRSTVREVHVRTSGSGWVSTRGHIADNYTIESLFLTDDPA